MQEITSPQNPRLKNAAKLRTRRGREKQNRIIIDGFREVGHAIDASTEITELFGCMSILNKEKRQRFEELAQRAKTEVFNVDTHVFNKLAFGDRAEGVVAVARKPNASLDQLNLPDSPLIGVIESIEKPGNVGAVIRSADGAGLDAVIVVSGGTDLYNPNAIRASLGGIFSMNVADASAQETILWLEQNNIKILAARVDGAQSYTKVDFKQPAAIVLGSEAHGLSSEWNRPSVASIALPMHGKLDSLNISASAAVLFYEARRQRG